MVVAERDEGGSADGNGVRPERHRLGDVGAGADAAGHDQLHVVMHAEFLQCLYRLRNRGEGGNADVFDEHVLRRGGAALHAVDDDHVGTALHGELDVVIGPGGTDLDVDGFFPVSDLAYLEALDGAI